MWRQRRGGCGAGGVLWAAALLACASAAAASRGEDLTQRSAPPVLASLLACLTETLNLGGIPFVLTDGSLLGAMRDGTLIPWDTDVDVAVAEKDRARLAALARDWPAGASPSCPVGWRLEDAARRGDKSARMPPFRLWSTTPHSVWPELTAWADIEVRADAEATNARVLCWLASVKTWCPPLRAAQAELAALYGAEWRRPLYTWDAKLRRWV
jgi:hypothetical protein